MSITPSNYQEYWKQHVEAYRKESLGKQEYCNIHQLKYHQFRYWLKKFKVATDVVPVRVKAPDVPESGVLCTLESKGGWRLKVHDCKSLQVILNLLASSHAVQF